ncbi:cysteine dioxygenase family protein [Psychroserpens sp. SPM9]|uniref:cysteine dioxygenase n=1 Tax=Psychroserpens sp. SPM9 TaxID=2975598 RepID=UPI0021A4539A|nr:cysteine dioxygenase family protein [Psychroserpens sp. SPM9]MDG5492851.1 cysteine dioxygenase family protein [Psychroserpens sp. SPM9]
MKSPEYIQQLIALLSTSSIENYNSILKNFDFGTVDFKSYESWSSQHYTRNCIYKDAHFELILLCWNSNQETTIHGHDGEDCWVYLVEGEMEEVFYAIDNDHNLLEVGAHKILPEQLTFMNDRLGFHKLRNSHQGTSISLHVYAKPIERCVSFDETSQQFVEKKLSFDTFKQLALND